MCLALAQNSLIPPAERRVRLPDRFYGLIPAGVRLAGETVRTWARTVAITSLFGQGMLLDRWQLDELPDCILKHLADAEELKLMWVPASDRSPRT